MERQDLSSHPGAAREGHYPDPIRQVVEKHRGCMQSG